MGFRLHKYWPTVIKILTIFFVIWVVSFFVSSTLQVHVLDWTHKFGYPIVFLWIVAANIVAGLPSSFLPIAIGLAAAKGEFNPTVAISVITLASVIGDTTAYALSRRFRHTFLRWLGIDEQDPNYQKAYRAVQHGGGGRMVFITRFLFAGILGFVNYAAGMLAMPFRYFFGLALLGEIIWSVIWFGIGYYPVELGEVAGRYWIVTVVLGFAVLATLYTFHLSYRRKGKSFMKVLWNTLMGRLSD
jgi:membrane-associated protein